ncbi:MAG TPA: helical backbone metal receptor [Ignavibacteria bacterium]|nr:helical backbone metal receptor [Ignavibacteria bacterium]
MKKILIFFLFFFISCNKSTQVSETPRIKVKDDLGEEISFDTLPKKIISLAPNITESIYFIDADSLLVGVTDFCDYPPQVSSKTKLGGYTNPNYEMITALKPDLILLTVEETSRPLYKALSDLGFKLMVHNPRTFDDIIRMIDAHGQATGKDESTKHLTDSLINLKSQIINDNNKNPLQDKNVFIVVGVNPLMTANKNTFLNEITGLAGLKNIYEEGIVQYPQINYEDVISKNPDYIILPGDTSNVSANEKYITELKSKLGITNAIKNDRIIIIDENLFFRPGPRILDAVQYIKYKLKQ